MPLNFQKHGLCKTLTFQIHLRLYSGCGRVVWGAGHKAKRLVPAMYQWCEFKSRRGKNKHLSAQRSNSNTVWFNFQTYIYIYICRVCRGRDRIATTYAIITNGIRISLLARCTRYNIIWSSLSVTCDRLGILLELDLWADKCLFFPRRDLNSHHWYIAGTNRSALCPAPQTTRPHPLYSLRCIWNVNVLQRPCFWKFKGI
jgi:hypothetical protein